jgi:6,7-dimethyl-8-ribityllumazine synthase
MAHIIPPRPRAAIARRAIAIVASQFNAEYVQGLVTHATNELRRLSPHTSVSLYQVPGAFEIPVVVRELALQQQSDAIIAMAVILKGKTGHAQNLSLSVTNALQQIALEFGVPVLNVVLSLTTQAQARERCLEEEINRGTEAARAALEIASVMADLRAKQSNG